MDVRRRAGKKGGLLTVEIRILCLAVLASVSLPGLGRANDLHRKLELPLPVSSSQWDQLLERSPFTRTLLLSDSLILTGVANVDNERVATLMDTEAAESILVSDFPSERGWKLLAMSETGDIETAVVEVLVDGGQVIKVRYDRERMKTASQRMKFAAQAKSQRVAARLRSSTGSGGNPDIPAERIAMLQKIDQRELPKGYNPGAGKNREESHKLHQSYVDKRLAGMSDRQKGMVSQLWKQKVSTDPGMANRGATFVRIMEHVAENEKR